MNRYEAADLIERHLDEKWLYGLEWCDFVEAPQDDKIIESYRRLFYRLNPAINAPRAPDAGTVDDCRSIIHVLRSDEPLSALDDVKMRDFLQSAGLRMGARVRPSRPYRFCKTVFFAIAFATWILFSSGELLQNWPMIILFSIVLLLNAYGCRMNKKYFKAPLCDNIISPVRFISCLGGLRNVCINKIECGGKNGGLTLDVHDLYAGLVNPLSVRPCTLAFVGVDKLDMAFISENDLRIAESRITSVDNKFRLELSVNHNNADLSDGSEHITVVFKKLKTVDSVQ